MFKKIMATTLAALGKKKRFKDGEEEGEGVGSADFEARNNTKDEGEARLGNDKVRSTQVRVFIAILMGVIVVFGLLVHFVQQKAATEVEEEAPESLKVELADKALDGEKMWRNYHEDELKKKSEELQARIDKAQNEAKETKDALIEDTKREIDSLKEQLRIARAELIEASADLRDVVAREQERLSLAPPHEPSVLEMQDFAGDTEYDIPKSAADYVPEGTYFTGYLLTGLVVSTALSTPDEGATPLTIRLKGRGNLASENKTDIANCRILGSAYGDLSSERAVIRLEKMVCKKGGMYITSHIAGDVHGPDGFNGIKGNVVSTGSKQIKNAMIGGVISGLGNSAKGQAGASITSAGLLSTRSQGFKDMAKDGLLSGVSNAGDKIADYYLRQAEAMSPVLTIPGGVRVNAHITKGFFIGEVGTHKRVEKERKGAAKKVSREAVEARNNNNSGDGSDDGWK